MKYIILATDVTTDRRIALAHLYDTEKEALETFPKWDSSLYRDLEARMVAMNFEDSVCLARAYHEPCAWKWDDTRKESIQRAVDAVNHFGSKEVPNTWNYLTRFLREVLRVNHWDEVPAPTSRDYVVPGATPEAIAEARAMVRELCGEPAEKPLPLSPPQLEPSLHDLWECYRHAWLAVAGCDSCRDKDVPNAWARRAVKDFREFAAETVAGRPGLTA